MIKIDNLEYSYKSKKVLKGLFLDIKANEKVSIIGQSGCGKSTLLKVIMGINDNYQGTVKVNGHDVQGIDSDISIVFQKNGLFDFLTISQNLELTKQDPKLISEVTSKLHIEGLLDKYPKALSGGQLQRANIARALIMRKQIMLLDEPTSSLDEFAKEEFQKQVMEALDSTDFGYLIVTHDIKEALVMSERIILLADGVVKKEFKSPFYGKTDSYLLPEFNQQYLAIKKEFYV